MPYHFTMALRIKEASVLRGTICNQTKGETLVKLEFTDGFTTEMQLKGNCWKDLAGRELRIENPKADDSLAHDPDLAEKEPGFTGDITASRKVKVSPWPVEQMYKQAKQGKKFPYEWKNSLYLEWFAAHGGRIVLEATEFELILSDAAWTMTEAEERQAQKDAQNGMTNFMNDLVNLAEVRESSVNLVDDNDELNEHDWEKFMRNSDKLTDRYSEALEKFGDDPEKINEAMGWDLLKEASIDSPEFTVESGDFEAPEYDDDYEVINPRDHPIGKFAHQIIIELEAELEAAGREKFNELGHAISSVNAKLSGALSGWSGGAEDEFDDNGFTIAYLKRCLPLIDTALTTAGDSHPSTSKQLLTLRQQIIDLQQTLRK